MKYFDDKTYVLITPISIYGQFFPVGTEYRHVNADWWYPFYNDALMPSYAVHYKVIMNNEQYFKLKRILN